MVIAITRLWINPVCKMVWTVYNSTALLTLLETLEDALVTVEIQPAKSGISGHVGIICTTPFHSKNNKFMERVKACEYICIALPMDWKAQEKEHEKQTI